MEISAPLVSNLSTYCISKGGLTAVFGNCYRSHNWSSLSTDYLLKHMLQTPGLQSVIALNFDRKSQYCADYTFGELNNSKLQVLDGTEFLEMEGGNNSSYSVVEAIVDRIKELIGESPRYGLVIYSISEVLLLLGLRSTRSMLRKFAQLLETQVSQTYVPMNSSKAVDGLESATSSIVLVVHETLHSTQTLAHIESLVSNVVRVVPNNNTLSPEVAVEIQTIRKTTSTGKVKESIEMFGYKGGFVYPLVPLNAISGIVSSQEGSDTGTLTDIEDSNSYIQTQLTELSSTTGSFQKISTNKSYTGGAEVESCPAEVVVKPVSAANKRLITFDSTDPEFDEDSDPDADLDL